MRHHDDTRAKVLELHAGGVRNQDIQKRLGLPPATVSRWIRAAREVLPTKLCECGCGRETGMNEATFTRYRFVFGHQTRLNDADLWSEDEHGCWIWQAWINERGYGVINRDGHQIAHRWVYEAQVGPIPPGLTLDHLCRVKACVNPAHLEPTTFAENSRRGMAVRLAARGSA